MLRPGLLSFLPLAVVALGCSKGTCIFDRGGEAEQCFINYPESTCEERGAEYRDVDGEDGVAHCMSEGFTQATKTGGSAMTDAELKAAVEKGDMVTFRKPRPRQ